MTQTLERPTDARTRPEADRQTRQPHLWRVVLLDDDDHTYEYVIRMVQAVFHVPFEAAFDIARTVDQAGRAVCLTTHKEHAEFKRDQCLTFGRDPLIASSKGPMSAIIEPADAPGDDDNAGSGRNA